MLIGHSMGGHLMLRHVAGEEPPVKGLVLSSPMVSFRTPLPGGLVRRIAQWMVKRGRGEGYALGQGPRPAAANSIRSEEHTSELQSLMRISYAVFCLKKKTKTEISK